MTEKQGQIVYRSLHAPKENGAVLIEPAIGEFAPRISKHYQTAVDAKRSLWGLKDVVASKALARHELFSILGLGQDATCQPIVMVGHQPQLFHPGVWMKNFVANRLAQLACGDKEAKGIAVNLVVDNDVMKSAAISVPVRGSTGATKHVAFDSTNEEMPYEERQLISQEVAATFAARVAAEMPIQNHATLLDSFWCSVTGNSSSDMHWGSLFSRARGEVERQWGQSLFDVSVSRLVNTQAFARLALEIVRDAHAFAEIYNSALAEYRFVHGLRSRSHPAPDLEIISEQEVEIPFWLWTKESPRRRRTFVHRSGNGFSIADREGLEWRGDFDEGSELVTRLMTQVLSQSDLSTRPKLRPKALITTLFARAFLCDGFVHGIGGYKYDQVTESIAARWGLGTLAPMQCATMTLRLPLPMEIVSIEEVRRRKRKLRELNYHPEKYLNEADLTAEQRSRAEGLATSKREWVGNTSSEKRRERHHNITAINAELATLLNDFRKRAEAEYHELQARFTAQQPWLSREFAAILFPEEMLKREFARVVGG